MNKSDVIDAIAAQTSLSKTDVAAVVSAFETVVVGAVKGGEKVQLPGFLSFERAHRAPRTGRNPQTGQEIQVPAAEVPKVKVGKSFKDAVNG